MLTQIILHFEVQMFFAISGKPSKYEQIPTA